MKNQFYPHKIRLERIHLKKPLFILLLFFMICICEFLVAQTAPQVSWIRQYGTTSTEWGWGVAAGENIYAAGMTTGTFPGQPKPGSMDAYVIKYNSGGEMQWIREFGTTSGEIQYTAAADASGVYATGTTSGIFPGQTSVGGQDLYLRKYDPDGNVLWTTQFGTTSTDMFPDGISLNATCLYIAGQTNGTFPGQSNAGYGDAFVVKFNLGGTLLWAREIGSTQNDCATGVYADNTGVYVCGWTYGSLPGQTGTGSDAFIVKYSVDGEMIWLHQFTCNPGATAFEIAGDETGLYVSGAAYGAFPNQTYYGAGDGFIAKFDRDGNQLWVTQYGTTGDEIPNGISVNASGIYTAGHTSGAFPGFVKTATKNIFVAKFSKDGVQRWVTQTGSSPRPGQTSSTDDVKFLSTASSYAYVSGYTSGVLPGQTTNGSTDAFLIKLVVNMPPVADCGDAQLDIITETVQLDGSGSSDSDGDTLSYQWSITSKPATSSAALSSTTAVNPTFVADVAGTYQVQLIANDGTVDGDTCVVTITVITPQQATQNLIGDVHDLVTAGVLNQGQGNALTVKLQAAIQKMNQENYNAAINNMNAFINQVNAFHNAGILSDEQADALIASANRIIAVLNNLLLKSSPVDPTATSDLLTWNVPNPFSTSTTIYYSLPEDLFVTLKVYDSRGKEIAVLTSGSMTTGTHSATLSAEGLPNGVYFYRIQAGTYMATKKLIVVH